MGCEAWAGNAGADVLALLLALGLIETVPGMLG